MKKPSSPLRWDWHDDDSAIASNDWSDPDQPPREWTSIYRDPPSRPATWRRVLTSGLLDLALFAAALWLLYHQAG